LVGKEHSIGYTFGKPHIIDDGHSIPIKQAVIKCHMRVIYPSEEDDDNSTTDSEIVNEV
jgi:hypothetical protein